MDICSNNEILERLEQHHDWLMQIGNTYASPFLKERCNRYELTTTTIIDDSIVRYCLRDFLIQNLQDLNLPDYFGNGGTKINFYTGECIKHCAFTNEIFPKVAFDGAQFEDCTFIKCSFISLILSQASFKNCIFKDCDFCNVTFINCFCENTDFINCLFADSCARQSRFTSDTFVHCSLFEFMMHKINAKFTRFVDCGLPGDIPRDAFLAWPKWESNCPDTGSFIGWKKIKFYAENKYDGRMYSGDALVKLEIPEDAQRSNAFGRKCRCSKAKVLEIMLVRNIPCYCFYELTDELTDPNTLPDFIFTYYSLFNKNFQYKIGDIILPDTFDSNPLNECSHGIHFFMTKEEAMDYAL